MSPDEPDAKPSHRSFQLTPERQLPTRHRVARAFIVIALVTLLASALVMCSCPEFFVFMAACLVISIVCGSPLQRLLSAGLMLVAITGFIVQFRAEQRTSERVRQAQERAQQQNQNQ